MIILFFDGGNMKNKITKEDLYKNLDIINQWINNSDSKASIILGLVGILLTIVFTNGSLTYYIMKIIKEVFLNINFSDILYLLFFLSSIGICVYGLYALIKVLIPTLKMKTNKTKSYMYFGSIAQYSSLKEYKEDLLEINEESFIDDLLNQVYQNSIICKKKYINFTKGIKCFIGGFISTLILYCIGILIYL